MDKRQEVDVLVRQAMKGQREALGQLAQRVEGRVSAYVFRVTLSRDLTEDLTQEVLLTMVRSLGDLQDPDRFRAWLYRIAQSKIQQHFRSRQRHPVAVESREYEDFVSQRADRHEYDGLRQLMHKDLVQKTFGAMRQLDARHRAILSLRCFDQMSYGDIALAMECSEVKARVLFYRAKEALKKQLSGQGIRKSMLVMCLGLFGKVTAPADAAPASLTVTAASMKTGLTAAILGQVSVKAAMAATAALVIGAAAMGVVSVLQSGPVPRRDEVRSVHFTTQLQYTGPQARSSLSKGAYEQWFQFPEGVDGPMFFRMQRWDPLQNKKLCAWLQDGQANYYFHGGARKLYITNDRVYWSSLKVRRLPTDSAEFMAFLSEIEGRVREVTYHRDPRTGILTGAVDSRFRDARHFHTTYEYNTTEPNAFELDWPDDTPVVDQRDAMHRRGWTYFTVQGCIGERRIDGRGRLPFVYDTWKEQPAWLILDAGDVTIVDCNEVAHIRAADGRLADTYPGGSFFAGLGRPWMGLHTIDLVRRDAAAQRIQFETNRFEEDNQAGVTLVHRIGSTDVDLFYLIDLDTDVIDEIRFAINKQPAGALRFTYLQDIEAVGDEFAEPEVSVERPRRLSDRPGLTWLARLAAGDLGR